MASRQHRGIAIDDRRNAGIIAFFRPNEVTPEALQQLLTKVAGGNTTAGPHVEKVTQAIAQGRVRPNPPLSQSLDEVADPAYGLGTHPDIVEALWKLDDTLPARCRWVLWGKPSLVHRHTGIVFAVTFGTIGMVLRLPPAIIESADPALAFVIKAGNPGQTFDIGPAGAAWRFIAPGAPAAAWCRAAHDFAGAPL